jgi:hypothetical protein
MGITYPPQDNLDESPVRVDQSTDPVLSLLEEMRGLERMNRYFGMTNIPTTFYRCLRRMPGFEGLW